MSDNVHASTHEILRMNDQNTKIEESEFVRTWLLTLHEYLSGGEVEVAIWLQEMNITVFAEVDVVDEEGDVLYTVPSILVKQDSILPKSVAAEVSNIMYRAENLNRNMPGKGDRYLKNELIDSVVEQKAVPTYQERWDAIFTRYDLEPVFGSGSKKGDVDIGGDDDEEFDDYEEL